MISTAILVHLTLYQSTSVRSDWGPQDGPLTSEWSLLGTCSEPGEQLQYKIDKDHNFSLILEIKRQFHLLSPEKMRSQKNKD